MLYELDRANQSRLDQSHPIFQDIARLKAEMAAEDPNQYVSVILEVLKFALFLKHRECALFNCMAVPYVHADDQLLTRTLTVRMAQASS